MHRHARRRSFTPILHNWSRGRHLHDDPVPLASPVGTHGIQTSPNDLQAPRSILASQPLVGAEIAMPAVGCMSILRSDLSVGCQSSYPRMPIHESARTIPRVLLTACCPIGTIPTDQDVHCRRLIQPLCPATEAPRCPHGWCSLSHPHGAYDLCSGALTVATGTRPALPDAWASRCVLLARASLVDRRRLRTCSSFFRVSPAPDNASEQTLRTIAGRPC
ncbi:hypothetical protein C8Q77DRAFT_820456 [Trametes polyzona]|nr:hypothetical protein C8Q77DRAFT_820456 [Trametes polyzona]